MTQKSKATLNEAKEGGKMEEGTMANPACIKALIRVVYIKNVTIMTKKSKGTLKEAKRRRKSSQ